ncbi:hypothetical protein [Streptomyces ipomoeae]|uniref:hypothetical protein n=1 Tax=Streptomyces ipomoeae TaxID=103232 RepID=UPI00114621A3|nr:hypothetical protein [Streptomyces ipomoeae]TQE33135.1 hypothetical protein Sipo7851_21815 [Streptomyces ipomoeae]
MTELSQAERDQRVAQAEQAIEAALADSWRYWRRWGRRPDFHAAALWAVGGLGDLAAEILVDGTMMRSLTAKDGVLTLDLESARDIVKLFVATMHGMLDGHGATNYLETDFTVRGSLSMDVRCADHPDQAYTVTIQKRSHPTPHELRQAAEQRLEAVLTECEQLEAELGLVHTTDAANARGAIRRIRAAAGAMAGKQQ